MAIDFYIKTGDTAPPITAVLKDAAETVVDLTLATEVRFIMKDKASGVRVVDAPAGVVGVPTDGTVRYQWQTGDTDIADTYNAEFEVAWSDGTFESFPNSKHVAIKIVLDLGGTVGQ